MESSRKPQLGLVWSREQRVLYIATLPVAVDIRNWISGSPARALQIATTACYPLFTGRYVETRRCTKSSSGGEIHLQKVLAAPFAAALAYLHFYDMYCAMARVKIPFQARLLVKPMLVDGSNLFTKHYKDHLAININVQDSSIDRKNLRGTNPRPPNGNTPSTSPFFILSATNC